MIIAVVVWLLDYLHHFSSSIDILAVINKLLDQYINNNDPYY